MKPIVLLFACFGLLAACSDDFATSDLSSGIKSTVSSETESKDPIPEGISLGITVFLSAPYTGGRTMHTALNDAGLIPLKQPYRSAPHFYDGGEQIGVAPQDMVDWILVSVHDPLSLEIVTQRALILNATGTAMDLDGNPVPTFAIRPGEYLVSVYHRNHLAILSDVAVDLSTGSGWVDFSTGNSGSREIAPGIYAMIKGDANADQLVKYNGPANDKNAVLTAVGVRTPANVLRAYHAADVNMDGYVKFHGVDNDREVILQVVGIDTPSKIVAG